MGTRHLPQEKSLLLTEILSKRLGKKRVVGRRLMTSAKAHEYAVLGRLNGRGSGRGTAKNRWIVAALFHHRHTSRRKRRFRNRARDLSRQEEREDRGGNHREGVYRRSGMGIVMILDFRAVVLMIGLGCFGIEVRVDEGGMVVIAVAVMHVLEGRQRKGSHQREAAPQRNGTTHKEQCIPKIAPVRPIFR